MDEKHLTVPQQRTRPINVAPLSRPKWSTNEFSQKFVRATAE